MRIGIDVGGTFTDLVAMDEGDSTPVVFKTPTTPDDPSDGVLRGSVHQPVNDSTSEPMELIVARNAPVEIVVEHDPAPVEASAG